MLFCTICTYLITKLFNFRTASKNRANLIYDRNTGDKIRQMLTIIAEWLAHFVLLAFSKVDHIRHSLLLAVLIILIV